MVGMGFFCFFFLVNVLAYATGEARTRNEDELLGCTAPSHLPKSPIRLTRLCTLNHSRPKTFLVFLGSSSPFLVSSSMD